jgi:hypothetical protein
VAASAIVRSGSCEAVVAATASMASSSFSNQARAVASSSGTGVAATGTSMVGLRSFSCG